MGAFSALTSMGSSTGNLAAIHQFSPVPKPTVLNPKTDSTTQRHRVQGATCRVEAVSVCRWKMRLTRNRVTGMRRV